MLVPVADIKVKKRIRKDMGDISGLADSMKHFGQISPIVISKDNKLIAGGRRLEAARMLGWRTINAVVAEIPDSLSSLEYEVEENIQRCDFSREELEDAALKIHRLRNPSIFRRIMNAIIKFFKWLFGA